MLRARLLQKNADPSRASRTRRPNSWQLGFQNLVVGAFYYFGDTRLERDKATGDRVRDKIDIRARENYAAFFENRISIHASENFSTSSIHSAASRTAAAVRA